VHIVFRGFEAGWNFGPFGCPTLSSPVLDYINCLFFHSSQPSGSLAPNLGYSAFDDSGEAVHSTAYSHGGTDEHGGRRQFLMVALLNVVPMNGSANAKGTVSIVQSELEGAA